MTECRAESSDDSKVEVEVIERSKSESIKPRKEDVPGAILPWKMPEECTVKQLQRWS